MGNVRKAAMAPKTDTYARPDSRVEYQLFGSEYFSAADVKLYFGDIWVEDITSLVFQLQEEIMPIFGYNSYTYDAVARGKRIINGAFSINFTSVGYLQQVVANANAIYYAIEEGKKKNILQPEYFQNVKLDEILQKLGKESFDQIADEYEKAIWGEETDTELQLNYADMPYFRQDDIGFDIRIQYGAVSESTSGFGDRFYLAPETQKPNTTVDVLNGVQLNGMAKNGIGTDSQGAPIQEQYTFMARDLNGVSFAHLKRGQTTSGVSTVSTDLNSIYGQM